MKKLYTKRLRYLGNYFRYMMSRLIERGCFYISGVYDFETGNIHWKFMKGLDGCFNIIIKTWDNYRFENSKLYNFTISEIVDSLPISEVKLSLKEVTELIEKIKRELK